VTHSRGLLFSLTGLLLISLACPLPAQSVQHITIAGRDVATWKPPGAAPSAGYPVIVFSHGFSGCNTQSGFRWMKGAANPDPLAPLISKPWPDRVSFLKVDLK
jgi:hypothetical protein